MSEWGYCEMCQRYVDLPLHRRETRVYMVRIDPDDDWERMCGEYYPFLTDALNTDGPRSAAEKFCGKVDSRNGYCGGEPRTVWVRLEGEISGGIQYRVDTQMVPEYVASKLAPCVAGCGQLVTLEGARCHECMRVEWRAERAAQKGGVVT